VVLHLFGALAEFERDLIRERSLAGLAAARARGRNGGRPTVMTPAKITRARALYDQGDLTVVEIAAKTLGVSRASVYRHVPPGRSEV
jgi:DNA invertase Pin-like site-specific DNA recombinase